MGVFATSTLGFTLKITHKRSLKNKTIYFERVAVVTLLFVRGLPVDRKRYPTGKPPTLLCHVLVQAMLPKMAEQSRVRWFGVLKQPPNHHTHNGFLPCTFFYGNTPPLFLSLGTLSTSKQIFWVCVLRKQTVSKRVERLHAC